MDEVGCDFVEVTAHAGARPEHALWQGRQYHRGGAMTYNGVRYPDFVSATHYGSGDGLCGWNCRHDFWPFWPGLSTPNHTDAELEALNAKTIEYNGEMYSEYEISQMQRAAERKVRAAKRTYLAEDAAGVDTTKAAVKLKQARQQLAQFIQDTGAYPFDSSARTSVAGFGRSEARRAYLTAERSHKAWLKSIGAEKSDLNTLAKYYEAKYNNTQEYQVLRAYANAVNKGDISPLVGIDLYKEYCNAIQKNLVGTTTSTGVKVESFAYHFVDRVIGQVSTPHSGKRCGVSIEDAKDALVHPLDVKIQTGFPGGDIRQKLYGDRASVVLSVRDNRLIQTTPLKGVP
jgi:hypothetical protein